MAQFVNIYKCDLHKGPVVTSLHQVFLGDVEANRVGVRVTDNGEDVTLSGTCSGTAILCNGGTVALTGTVDGSLAYVDLPSAVYTVEGPVEIYVTLTQGDQTTTLLTAHGNAVRTDSGVVIDPGTIIPSVAALISDIDEAVASIPADYSDLLGTIAPDFSSSTAYTAGQYVWYSGTLYRFTSDHAAGSWTGTDVIAAEIGEDVADLKGAIETAVSKSYDYSGNLADTTGVEKTGQYTDYVTFDLVGVGAYYTNPFANGINSDSSANYLVTFLDSNGDAITATKNSDQTTSTVIGSNYSKAIYTINGNALTLTVYFPNGNVSNVEYTLSAVPAKIKYRTRWWDADKAQINGFTYNHSSATYVHYSAPSTVYSPNPDFADDIKDYYLANGFIDSTFDVSGSAADSMAVGDELYDRKGITFETSHGWIRPSDGAFISGSAYTATDYIPVTPGETIRVNRPALSTIEENAYYNASKQYVSRLTTPSNQTDLTIPSGVCYVRFSDYNRGFVGFSVERTGLWTRIRDAISESSGEAEYRNLIEQSKYGSNVLTLLHFSDLHMDATTMGFINTFRTRYAEFLDDVIQTGDTSNGFSNDWTTLVSVGLGDCLGVIGNHEALGSSKNSATQQELHEKYIAPYISDWNVTQPTGVDDSTSDHYCANYYYKDYASATVRLIVLDTQKWSSAQLSWFTDTLASARTAGYAVIVASHVLPGAVTITDCNFSAKYSNGANITHAFPTDDAPLASEDAVSAVNDFITAGGEFTVWIGGHEHADIFGVFTNYPNVTAYMIDKASIERETPGAARISGEKNQHAFNVMSIVRSGKLIKIVRIGEDVDGMMRGKHVFCYNYNTKTIISQW